MDKPESDFPGPETPDDLVIIDVIEGDGAQAGLRKGRVSAGEEPFGGPVWVAGVVS